MRFLIWVWLALFSMPAASSASTAAARAALDSLGIEYREGAFFEAAKGGDSAVVKLFVESGMSVETADSKGYTALHFAALKGHLAVVKSLVKNGAAVNARDNYGATALHFAAWEGHLEVVRSLVEELGLDVYAKNKAGEMARDWAAERGHTEVVEYLKSVKAFREAVWDGDPTVVKLFVESGMSVHTAVSQYGFMALSAAARYGHLSVVRYLVGQGLDVNATENDGTTALHSAAWKGHLSVVRYLVEQGADVKAKNNDSWTALHEAAMSGHLSVVKYLVGQGADVNATHDSGSTALIMAATNDRLAVVVYLGGGRERYAQRRLDGSVGGGAEWSYGGCGVFEVCGRAVALRLSS